MATWLCLGHLYAAVWLCVGPLPWGRDVSLGDLSGLPGNVQLGWRRVPSLLAEGQAEPQPTSHETGSVPPGVGLFSQIPQTPSTSVLASRSVSPVQDHFRIIPYEREQERVPGTLRAPGPPHLECTAEALLGSVSVPCHPDPDRSLCTGVCVCLWACDGWCPPKVVFGVTPASSCRYGLEQLRSPGHHSRSCEPTCVHLDPSG